jgi:hypothetical protein
MRSRRNSGKQECQQRSYMRDAQKIHKAERNAQYDKDG